MEKIFTPFATEIFLGKDLLAAEVSFFSKQKGKVIIVADVAILELYARNLSQKAQAELIPISGGEKVKTQQTVDQLIDKLFRLGADRETMLVGVGGGATTDLVGFVSSIYLRGIPLALIPTTLLGSVDAAIGGKTGIDLPFGKNLIGTIYHPNAIFIDLQILQTLPKKQWLNGLAEILKIGLVQNESLWNLAEVQEVNLSVIELAIREKIGVIEKDPNDNGIRRILNFGHTIGHALESAASYQIAHGEAVALGCLVESYLSMHLGYLSEEDFQKIQKGFAPFPLKLPTRYTRGKFLQALSHDKKKQSGAVRFVLIDRIGRAIPFDGAYCRAVDQKKLENALNWMESSFQ